jgi:hypothetical protein
VHSAYATVLAAGPLPLRFRHSTSVTGGLVLTNLVPAFGALASTKWTANIPWGKLALDVAWAQGLGSASWVPIAGKGLADVTSLTTANGARAGGDFSFSPVKRVSVGIKGDVLFRADLTQPAGLAGFLAGNTQWWLGAETTFYGSWKTSSELNLGWNTGVFYPNPAAVTSSTIPTFLAVLTATLEL